jgi:hypothetical protein
VAQRAAPPTWESAVLPWLESAGGFIAATTARTTILLVFRPLPNLRWIDVAVLGLTVVAGLGAYQHARREKQSGLLLVGLAALVALALALLSALGLLFVGLGLLVLIAALLGVGVEFDRATHPSRPVLYSRLALAFGLLVGAIVLWVLIPRPSAVTVMPSDLDMLPSHAEFRTSPPESDRGTRTKKDP